MKNLKYYLGLISILFLLLFLGCKKDNKPSVASFSISTTVATDITAFSATYVANITKDGGSPITVSGVCWSTNSNPTINDNKSIDGKGIGSFTSKITGLSPNTTYYVRAYATNGVGTAYGSQIIFTTTFASLDGVWERGEIPDIEITFSGSVGTFTKIYSNQWLLTLNNGLISLGSQKYKNISKTGTNKWTTDELWTTTSGTSLSWATSGTITMSDDGNKLDTWSVALDGTINSTTYIRKLENKSSFANAAKTENTIGLKLKCYNSFNNGNIIQSVL